MTAMEDEGLWDALRQVQTYAQRDQILSVCHDILIASNTTPLEQARNEMEQLAKALKMDVEGVDEMLRSVLLLVKGAIYDTNDVLKRVKQSDLDPSFKQMVLQYIEKHAKGWQETRLEETFTLPKLVDFSWKLELPSSDADQTSAEPAIDMTLQIEDSNDPQKDAKRTVQFSADRGLITLLTESMSRIRNELQAVSKR